MSGARAELMTLSSNRPQPMIGIVDDDPIVGESLMQRLQLEGYQVTWWQSGEEALLHLHDTACQVLVCDIRLPDLDGEQLFRRALPSLGATPVIFITAFAEVEQAVRLIRAGADDYLTKPFEVETLLGKISALCARELVAGNSTPGREALRYLRCNARCRSRTSTRQGHAQPHIAVGRDRGGQGGCRTTTA